ncbi:MAG: 50S ribosomal protein L25/general stress protein Ctc [bacterium]
MSTDVFIFDCEVRQRAGTGGSRAVRRDGWIPAVLYGGDAEPVNIKLRYNQILKAYNTGRLIDILSKIRVEGQDDQLVIGRDIQVDPVKDLPMHVDLMRVSDKTRVKVNVPMRFLNEEDCPGLKTGGVLNVVRHDIEVNAPATAIPEALEIDLSEAEVGDTIHASALNLPKGVDLTVTDRDFTVATIAAPSALRSAEDEAEDASDEEEVEGEAESEGESEE